MNDRERANFEANLKVQASKMSPIPPYNVPTERIEKAFHEQFPDVDTLARFLSETNYFSWSTVDLKGKQGVEIRDCVNHFVYKAPSSKKVDVTLEVARKLLDTMFNAGKPLMQGKVHILDLYVAEQLQKELYKRASTPVEFCNEFFGHDHAHQNVYGFPLPMMTKILGLPSWNSDMESQLSVLKKLWPEHPHTARLEQYIRDPKQLDEDLTNKIIPAVWLKNSTVAFLAGREDRYYPPVEDLKKVVRKNVKKNLKE